MKIIGLTGPSGAGKGFCYRLFSKFDIPCIDTDDVYHKLLIPPSECVNELENIFGKEILDSNGYVDRKILAKIVFSDESHQKLNILNNITHKYVLEQTKRLIFEAEKDGKIAVVIDAPLLFESEFDKHCDFSIAVISDEETRLARIMARDSLSKDAALMRIRSQNKNDYYVSRAKYTVTNNTEGSELDSQLERILTVEKIIK